MLSFLFPGQGSQRPDMSAGWSDHPSWELISEAERILGSRAADVLAISDEAELARTDNAQLATCLMSLVVLDAVERVGIEPTSVAGHSLGEFTALIASGAVSIEEGLSLVSARGEAMLAATVDAPGTMAAVIGLSYDDVDAACHRAGSHVWVANINAANQIVIAGEANDVEKAGEIAKSMGAKKIIAFPVSGAFHTPLMQAARTPLESALKSVAFRDAEVPVYANVDARCDHASTEWPSLLSAQLTSPVRWLATISNMIAAGTTTFVEIGPGGVLAGLIRRIDPNVKAISVSKPDDIDQLVDELADNPTMHHWRNEHQGEHLYVSERLVVSTRAGLFEPHPPSESEEPSIEVGTMLGKVGDDEVKSPFAGKLMGYLAIAGERVSAGQPIAWLRSA